MKTGSISALLSGAAAFVGVCAAVAVRGAEIPGAQKAAAAASASTPLVFRQDDQLGFPVGGAVLLGVLLLIAGLAWWARRRAIPGGWLTGLVKGDGPASDVLRVETSLPLDAQTRLYVVHWKGGDLLVAAGGAATPVVLDRATAAPASGSAP